MYVVLGFILRRKRGREERKKEENFEVEIVNCKVRIYLVIQNHILEKVEDKLFLSGNLNSEKSKQKIQYL